MEYISCRNVCQWMEGTPWPSRVTPRLCSSTSPSADQLVTWWPSHTGYAHISLWEKLLDTLDTVATTIISKLMGCCLPWHGIPHKVAENQLAHWWAIVVQSWPMTIELMIRMVPPRSRGLREHWKSKSTAEAPAQRPTEDRMPSFRKHSVQFSHSVVSDSLWPHELEHAWPPCPSPTPGVHPNPCQLSQWCRPTISSSVVPCSPCPQSCPASGSFPMSQLFTSGGQSIGVSASTSVLPANIQDWSHLGWTGWISLQSKGLSRVFNTTVQKASILWCSAFFIVQL